ncbi:cellulase family glycosylhydrolase [Candidatus Sumerlaeota bacterium]|nr:cellulase family glycosylhydrolase [Candidatus Sumerlaeota bacterium]
MRLYLFIIMACMAVRLFITGGLPTCHAFEVGIDTNAPISAITGDIAAPAQTVADTGATFVRVNFILGPWSSPHDSTPHGAANRTWFQTYDEIVNGFVNRGVKVYGLIGAEAVHSSASGLNEEQYVQDYKANFVEIVGHFKDRIRIFESFNEPNDWAGGGTAQVQPYWFARMLEEIYLGAKYEDGHSSETSWQVDLVSGPLFSHDLDNVASYLQDVIDAGINDLHWNEVLAKTGSYPLDGLGYHIYVKQGSSDPSEIRHAMKSNLDAVWNVFTGLEGEDIDKKIYVSELGWTTDYVTESVQADNLDTAFNYLRSDSRIQLGVWFCLKDFPGGHYGIFCESGLGLSDRKPSWYRFYYQAKPPFSSLQNRGFETGDLSGWSGYGERDGVQSGSWFAGMEAFEGEYFYGAAANWGQKNGGLLQRVRIPAGETVRLSGMVRTYRVGGSAGDTACRIGIHPNGSDDHLNGEIVWSDWMETSNVWSPVQVQTVLVEDVVAVFLEYKQNAPEWNITAFDDITLSYKSMGFSLY